MAATKETPDTMLEKAKSAFKEGDYATTYKICTELMKGKTASIVVYMHCVSSLKLRTTSKEFVDTLINDTLLLSTALDNFYKQSSMQNQKINMYIREILFTLMTSTIENIQKNYPLNKGRRALKQAASSAKTTVANLKILKSYDLSGFSAELPAKLNTFLNLTGERLLAYMTNWVNILRDPTNNWLYEDDTNDLYERIVAYKSAVDAEEEVRLSGIDEEVKSFVTDVAKKSKPVKKPLDIPVRKAEPETRVKKEEVEPLPDIPEEDELITETPQIMRKKPGRFLKPIDILIGILVVLFIVVISIIVIYAIKPALIMSLIS